MIPSFPYAVLAYLDSGLAATTIVLGGIVEGYGYGLSLGTNWPYTRNMMDVAFKGDPEAIHRISATLVGLISLTLLITDFNMITLVGFISIIFTALLGMATLYVLAGKLPSIFQGFHDIAAYTTFVSYLLLATGFPASSFISFLENAIIPPHFLYFVIFMGGVVTGTRRMRLSIGDVRRPKNKLQWAWAIHGIAAIIFFIALIYLNMWISLGFGLAEAAIGILTYRAINKNPEKPGILIGLHQLLSLAVVVSLLFA
ncbi:cytochrome C oxidase assembly protein [Stygiolobus caldivivus]|nr:cytochrome C oxidase assembly protein [Stygiolobus caldivivus]